MTSALFSSAPTEPVEPILRVSAVNRAVKQMLERDWRDVWIEGELSDVTKAASGHIYFTLNDNEDPAQLRCVMFRSDARVSPLQWKDGENIRIFASLSLYEPRGAFQAIARRAIPTGLGALKAQFERLRKQLLAEGLLDPQKKRPLPAFPSYVGVVTSASGAAIHDILKVARRRAAVPILLSPCLVQGIEAPESIVAAIQALARLPEIDVIIIGRGGGSAEDLFAFNDERVVRAIASCPIPTVSAVGHEIDVTLSDLVADVRAATPSHAAELVFPDSRALAEKLLQHERALARAMEVYLGRLRLKLSRLSPLRQFQQQQVGAVRQRLQHLHMRLVRQGFAYIETTRKTWSHLRERLAQHNVQHRLALQGQKLNALCARLETLGRQLPARSADRLSQCTAKLTALSPLRVLSRGYSITLNDQGIAVLDASDLSKGERVTLRFHVGSREATIRE